MIYANKKVNQKKNSAKQNALIIANVKELEQRNMIRMDIDTVYLQPQLWKDKVTALNWINCLHRYYMLKRKLKSSAPLYFKDMATNELIGNILNKKAKVLILNDLS